ncbi:MAG: 30S ribosomal protein S8e [archaeon]|nr:30S ribosomal protein S8e [Nanoarchaeota archaeon]
MARAQNKSRRKISGGRYVAGRSKKKSELAGFPANTKLAERKSKTVRTLGDNKKSFLLSCNVVNVAGKDGKVKKVTIKNVVENKANPHLVRRNVLTKGAIVETELGKVRITSRPGQEATINGVLV